MSGKAPHICWLALLCLLYTLSANAQRVYTVNYDILLLQLEEALGQGNPRALHELAGIMDKAGVKGGALEAIRQHSLFPESQIRVDSTLDRQRFLDFLNQHGDNIQYSPILRAFYTTPLEEFPVEYQITRKRIPSQRDKSALLEHYVKVLKAASGSDVEVFAKYQLRRIAELGTHEGYGFLVSCLAEDNLPKGLSKSAALEENICQALCEYDDPMILETLLRQAQKGRMDNATVAHLLHNYTNVAAEGDKPRRIVTHYRHLLDSLGTLRDLRLYGFRQNNTADISYFMDEVDYYGYMLTVANGDESLRDNALRGLAASRHPRGLFYLAGVLYAHADDVFFDKAPLERLLDRQLALSVQVRDGKGRFRYISDRNKDAAYYLQLATYWAAHHIDYEYDDETGLFVNTRLEQENKERAAKLFVALTNKDGDEAMRAYRQLCKQPWNIIAEVGAEYQGILRRAHPDLPDFRYGFLESLSNLHEFCEVEGIPLDLPDFINEKIESLKGDLPISERYALENELLEEVTADDLTVLEIEGLLNSKNEEFNFSVSRILDIYYSRNFYRLLGSEIHTRTFLKKTVLFGRIGTGGICNRYHSKLDEVGGRIAERLREISNKEYDPDIKDAIAFALSDAGGEETAGQSIPFASFIQSPLDYGDREVQLVAEPSAKNLQTIFKKINKETDTETILKYFEYLSFHASGEYTLHLLPLLTDERVLAERGGFKRTVADDAVLLLENIYNYSFGESLDQAARTTGGEWLALYKNEKNPQLWNGILFHMEVERVTEMEYISSDDLNRLFEHELMDEGLLEKCLAALSRLESPNDVRDLYLPKPLSPSRHLGYFAGLGFRSKYLDDVLDLFSKKQSDSLLRFAMDYLEEKPTSEQGKTYNRLAELEWFLPTLLEGDTERRMMVAGIMQTYLDEADYISEFEEQRVMNRVFILRYGGDPIADKLRGSLQFSEDPAMTFELQQSLLTGLPFASLGEALSHAECFVEPAGQSAFQFLEKGFGIPPYLLATEEARREFISDSRHLTEREIYGKYLSRAGLELFPNDRFDYELAREVLEHDVVVPFAGTIARHRSGYAIGVMRLLNTLHPEAELRFSPEGDIREQVRAWVAYLYDTGKLPARRASYSFNRES